MIPADVARGSQAGDPMRLADVMLRPDPRRVITRLFLPGQETLIAGTSRATVVVQRCLAMGESEVVEVLAATLASYAGRHRDLEAELDAHFDAVAHRVGGRAGLSINQRRLIGAYFTHEYSIEAAALFNPSMVLHPDQSGLGAGEVRFVMSARAVGEGHISSIVFHTGVVEFGGQVHFDPPSAWATTGTVGPAVMERDLVRRQVTEAGGHDLDSLEFVLDLLPDHFDADALEVALAALQRQSLTRVDASETDALLRQVAQGSYTVEFAPETELAERVLWPSSPGESHGIEDARFVRFTDDDGSVTFRGTYTAFDGSQVAPRLMETDDFRVFRAKQFAGSAAANKGLALFPRRVGGRYAALSRWDRESNALVFSDDGRTWDEPQNVQIPGRSWDLIQLGNCGSPIETSDGWLVITHGVGPMRTYRIGAILLDLEDPSRVIADLPDPLMAPTEDEREGYVPNVVYSCGALLHGNALVMPYGCSDSSIRVAVFDVAALLNRMLGRTDEATFIPPAQRLVPKGDK